MQGQRCADVREGDREMYDVSAESLGKGVSDVAELNHSYSLKRTTFPRHSFDFKCVIIFLSFKLSNSYDKIFSYHLKCPGFSFSRKAKMPPF